MPDSASPAHNPNPVVRGFVYSALTPVGITLLTIVALADGNLFSLIWPGEFIIAIAALISTIATCIVGIPLHQLYRRWRITSLKAYGAAGLTLSVMLLVPLLWHEYTAGYENAQQSLFLHVFAFAVLLSGPAAAFTFWRTVRPDLGPQPHVASAIRRPSRMRWIAAAAIGVAWIGFSVYQTGRAPRLAPLTTENLTFDTTKSAALAASLLIYSNSHRMEMAYYFIPLPRPSGVPSEDTEQLFFHATLRFAEGIEISIVTLKGTQLRADIYADNNRTSIQSDRIWAAFVPYLHDAVDRANATPLTDLPAIPNRGENNKERTWWDWRFHPR